MIEIGDVVKFTKTIQKYEDQITNVNRIGKYEYIGQCGTVTSVVCVQDEPTSILIDVLFNDNQKWCFEKEQLEVVSPIKELRDKASRKVVCVETGEVFESARKAGRSIGVTPQAIRTCCRVGSKVKGKHWRYTE